MKMTTDLELLFLISENLRKMVEILKKLEQHVEAIATGNLQYKHSYTTEIKE